ncbi:MAG TPA: hypothetical protein VL326_24960 [Kofleriaceae bacterium]|jgi:hypothetical protein|nr:hypothetical protein [Kofleriaceae bacterium]
MKGDIVGSLVCVAMASDTRVIGLDDQRRVALRAGTWFKIGAVERRHDVVVRGVSIPASQASHIIIMIDDDGRCRARDSGHNFRVRVNDHEVSTPRVLVDGDILESYLFDTPLGVRFRFESPPQLTQLP